MAQEQHAEACVGRVSTDNARRALLEACLQFVGATLDMLAEAECAPASHYKLAFLKLHVRAEEYRRALRAEGAI